MISAGKTQPPKLGPLPVAATSTPAHGVAPILTAMAPAIAGARAVLSTDIARGRAISNAVVVTASHPRIHGIYFPGDNDEARDPETTRLDSFLMKEAARRGLSPGGAFVTVGSIVPDIPKPVLTKPDGTVFPFVHLVRNIFFGLHLSHRRGLFLLFGDPMRAIKFSAIPGNRAEVTDIDADLRRASVLFERGRALTRSIRAGAQLDAADYLSALVLLNRAFNYAYEDFERRRAAISADPGTATPVTGLEVFVRPYIKTSLKDASALIGDIAAQLALLNSSRRICDDDALEKLIVAAYTAYANAGSHVRAYEILAMGVEFFSARLSASTSSIHAERIYDIARRFVEQMSSGPLTNNRQFMLLKLRALEGLMEGIRGKLGNLNLKKEKSAAENHGDNICSTQLARYWRDHLEQYADLARDIAGQSTNEAEKIKYRRLAFDAYSQLAGSIKKMTFLNDKVLMAKALFYSAKYDNSKDRERVTARYIESHRMASEISVHYHKMLMPLSVPIGTIRRDRDTTYFIMDRAFFEATNLRPRVLNAAAAARWAAVYEAHASGNEYRGLVSNRNTALASYNEARSLYEIAGDRLGVSRVKKRIAQISSGIQTDEEIKLDELKDLFDGVIKGSDVNLHELRDPANAALLGIETRRSISADPEMSAYLATLADEYRQLVRAMDLLDDLR